MELFTNLEIIIIVSVVGSLLLVIALLSIMEIISRIKEKKNVSLEDEDIRIENTKEDKEDFEIETDNDKVDIEKEIEIETDLDEDFGELVIQRNFDMESNLEVEQEKLEESHQEVTTNLNLNTYDNHEEILIEDMDDVKPKNLNEEVEVLELEPSKAELELLKIKEELEHPLSLEDTITSLEKEEEDSAIISYQELLEATSELQIIEDLEDEPISITEVYERFTGEKVEHPSVEDLYQASLVNQESDLNEIQLENTANLEKLDKEIRKTNKVLNMLNELKKNLD